MVSATASAFALRGNAAAEPSGAPGAAAPSSAPSAAVPVPTATAAPASPGAAVKKKAPPGPSAAAAAIAATMRRFDPALTDAQVERIARDIDDNSAGAALNPKKKRLRNADEPVLRFAADPE